MSTGTAKRLVEEVLSRLPDDATIEDVQYSLYVADLVRRRTSEVDSALNRGVDQALKQGKLVSHEDVVSRMARWLRK